MNVRAVISRSATSRQSACTRPLTIGSIRCRIVSGDTSGLDWASAGSRLESRSNKFRSAVRRLSIRLILFKLRESEPTGAGSFPGLFSRAQKSFDENRRQAARRGRLLCGIPNTLIDRLQFVVVQRFL
jgi:hypothetical protein